MYETKNQIQKKKLRAVKYGLLRVKSVAVIKN